MTPSAGSPIASITGSEVRSPVAINLIGLGQATLGKSLHEADALLSGGDEQKHRIGPGVLDPLQEWRKIGVLHRRAYLATISPPAPEGFS